MSTFVLGWLPPLVYLTQGRRGRQDNEFADDKGCSFTCLLFPSQPQGGLAGWIIFEVSHLSLYWRPCPPHLFLFGAPVLGIDSLPEQMVSGPLLLFAQNIISRLKVCVPLVPLLFSVVIPFGPLGQSRTAAAQVEGGKAEPWKSRPEGNASSPPLEGSSFPQSGSISSFIHSSIQVVTHSRDMYWTASKRLVIILSDVRVEMGITWSLSPRNLKCSWRDKMHTWAVD